MHPFFSTDQLPGQEVQGAHRAARTVLAALHSCVLMPGMALMGCQLPQGVKTLKDFRLVESQSQKSRGWEEPLEIILNSPTDRQSHLEQVTQECSQVGF